MAEFDGAVLKGATQACCKEDANCTDLMNTNQKIKRFENMAVCEQLSLEASRVGGMGVIGQCEDKETAHNPLLHKSRDIERAMKDIRYMQDQRRQVGPPAKTALAVRIPAHRGTCCEPKIQKELRLADCIGPECPCPPVAIEREDCDGDHFHTCNCEQQTAKQVGLEAALNTKRFDAHGDTFCTCQEYATNVDEFPARPLAAYKGVNCPKCTKPLALTRPELDPPLPQQEYMRFGNRLTRVPPPSCPCSLVKPANPKEAPTGTNNFVHKWAMFETGAAFEWDKQESQAGGNAE